MTCAECPVVRYPYCIHTCSDPSRPLLPLAPQNDRLHVLPEKANDGLCRYHTVDLKMKHHSLISVEEAVATWLSLLRRLFPLSSRDRVPSTGGISDRSCWSSVGWNGLREDQEARASSVRMGRTMAFIRLDQGSALNSRQRGGDHGHLAHPSSCYSASKRTADFTWTPCNSFPWKTAWNKLSSLSMAASPIW